MSTAMRTSFARSVRNGIDETHVEGIIKAEIMADPETVRIDHRPAGCRWPCSTSFARARRLMLISNSEWPFTPTSVMSYAYDRYLPQMA